MSTGGNVPMTHACGAESQSFNDVPGAAAQLRTQDIIARDCTCVFAGDAWH